MTEKEKVKWRKCVYQRKEEEERKVNRGNGRERGEECRGNEITRRMRRKEKSRNTHRQRGFRRKMRDK